MFDFTGKAVLVTGATSGMGRVTAEAFAKAGASVALVGRREAEGKSLEAAIRNAGGAATFFAADLSAGEAVVADIVSRTVATYGRLDIAFNNAGTEGKFGPITELTEADFDATNALNLKAVWLCAKHEFAQFQKQGAGGVIVNTSSWLAHGALVGSSIYSAGKGGLDGMMRALALEGGAHGIRVNNINPGFIDTEMMRRFVDPDSDSAVPFRNAVPLQKRVGSSDDIAGAVLWLCSEGAGYVTGQTLLIDGGLTIAGL